MVSAKHEPFHVLFEDLHVKWKWTESELVEFRQMWKDGVSIHDIAKEFKTNKRSIALLVMDQGEQKEIKPRKNGLLGD